MAILVPVELHDGRPVRDSLGAVAKALQLGDDVTVVVCGFDVAAAADELATCGAVRILVADSEDLDSPLPQPRVDVLAHLVRERRFDTVVLATTVLGADIAAGLSARLGAGLNWDLSDLELREGRLVGSQLALGDSVRVAVGWKGAPRLALLRPGTFEPAPGTGPPAPVERVTPTIRERSRSTVLLDRTDEHEAGSRLETAQVIVAGGRGLGGRDGFRVLEELAGELGGAVGATMPVVDAGWYPYAAQVGQTGRSVAPRAYLACGISGAIQHKVGMQRSGTIIAINQDRSAPIFGFCDLAVVGDLHEIVPRVTALLRERRGAGMPDPA